MFFGGHSKKRIDYVMVFDDITDPIKIQKRECYQRHLFDAGLDIEIRDKLVSADYSFFIMSLCACFSLSFVYYF